MHAYISIVIWDYIKNTIVNEKIYDVATIHDVLDIDSSIPTIKLHLL